MLTFHTRNPGYQIENTIHIKNMKPNPQQINKTKIKDLK